jgi:hypothetical protein
MATPGWTHLKAARPELVEAILHAAVTGSLPPAQQAQPGAAPPGPA